MTVPGGGTPTGSGIRRQPLRLAIKEAERMLAAAQVPSPRVDAELLAAHVLGIERGRLPLVPLVDTAVIERYRQLVARRAQRVPLQHLLGQASLGGVTVSVGPGVFVPRPETELLLEWGLAVVERRRAPVVVDLCTGSGVLALAVAAARPDAEVHAVDDDPAALAWARRNLEDAGSASVRLHAADVRDQDALVDLEDRVDLVLCNPPYVADGTELPPEVADHDPARAVLGGPDGLTVIRAVIALAAGLLRRGGGLAIEHDASQGAAVAELLGRRRVLTDVAEHDDLAGRPRFATAFRR
jgi:release factor glutamine methyltransferase